MLNNFKFNFKIIPISYRKLSFYSKILSNKPILFYINNIYLKKIDFYLKKITNTIINNCKTTNIFVKQFYIGKSKIIKKINFRAKGRINFYIRRYSNIILNIIYG
ncbi:uL22 family ribosomal protein [Candidatus Carsonella ruddii]|uniref:uL22 family ribosomal protein n=1 Tax=Carsonella ruddii TaxID=114186 RepID=UPI003D9AAD9F